MKIETYQLWEDRDDVELTTFLTMADSFIKDPKPKPAVIVCPGGAYFSCPRHGNEGDPVAMAFAADGYQAFVLEYSVAERAPAGKTLFPAQLLDFGKAMLLIRQHAAEWYINPDQISIVGFSAGAHLCGMLATTWHEKLLTEYFHEPSEYFRPLSAILLYGLFDYHVQNVFNRTLTGSFLPEDCNSHVFGCKDPTEEQEKKYSPYWHVSQDTVPMFLAAAVDDGMVPSIQSVRMAEKLHETGIPYEFHMFQYGDHGFALGRNLFEPWRQDLAHACAAWLPLARTFLAHQTTPETLNRECNPFSR